MTDMTPMAPVPAEDVNRALWRALLTMAEGVAAQDDPRASKESADACLSIAQAIVVLDPTRIAPQGVPPEVLAASVPQPPPADKPKAEGK